MRLIPQYQTLIRLITVDQDSGMFTRHETPSIITSSIMYGWPALTTVSDVDADV